MSQHGNEPDDLLVPTLRHRPEIVYAVEALLRLDLRRAQTVGGPEIHVMPERQLLEPVRLQRIKQLRVFRESEVHWSKTVERYCKQSILFLHLQKHKETKVVESA